MSPQPANSPKELAEQRPTTSIPSQFLTWPLFVVVTIILFLLFALLAANLFAQHKNYAAGVSAAITNVNGADHVAVLIYSRAWDAAIQKTSALFFAYIVLFVGALYVLRSADTAYRLSLEGKEIKGALETSSPGLVMITLGVALVTLVLYAKTTIDIEHSQQTTPAIISAPAQPATTKEPSAVAKPKTSKGADNP